MTELEKLQDENELLKERVERLLAEKEEVLDLAQRLSEKNTWWENEYKSMESEFSRLRAQMDIVYLIFGGRK